MAENPLVNKQVCGGTLSVIAPSSWRLLLDSCWAEELLISLRRRVERITEWCLLHGRSTKNQYEIILQFWLAGVVTVRPWTTANNRKGDDEEEIVFLTKKKVQWKQNVKSWNQSLITVSVQQGKKLHRIICTIIIWKWVEWNLCYLSWCSLWAYVHKSLTVFQNRDSWKKQNIPVFNFKVNLTTFAKTFKNLLAY